MHTRRIAINDAAAPTKASEKNCQSISVPLPALKISAALLVWAEAVVTAPITAVANNDLNITTEVFLIKNTPTISVKNKNQTSGNEIIRAKAVAEEGGSLVSFVDILLVVSCAVSPCKTSDGSVIVLPAGGLDVDVCGDRGEGLPTAGFGSLPPFFVIKRFVSILAIT